MYSKHYNMGLVVVVCSKHYNMGLVVVYSKHCNIRLAVIVQ